MAEHIRDFWGRVQQLRADRVPVVTATVVARHAPMSSHIGDRALIFEDGRMEGFVGGACSREIVRRHALDALRTGHPRFLKLRAERTTDGAGGVESVVAPLTCASEGAADIYIEPHIPAPVLLVAGCTPIASTLAQLALALDYRVVRAVDESERRDAVQADVETIDLESLSTFLGTLSEVAREEMIAVVASQGHYDERALEPLLRTNAGFIGLLASRQRGLAVKETLVALSGFDENDLKRIRTPVGLDIGATTPGEVAVSILAEVSRYRIERDAEIRAGASAEVARLPVDVIDPVCGMSVEPAGAQYAADHGGRAYLFCSARCKAEFVRAPERYLAGTA